MSYEAWGEPDDDYMSVDQAIEAGWISPDCTSKAMIDVFNERIRQHQEEHFDPAHDDQHVKGEMLTAAICYITPAVVTAQLLASGMPPELEGKTDGIARPSMWPWSWEWWKPKDRRRNLIRAAALIVAEVERLDRVAAKAVQP